MFIIANVVILWIPLFIFIIQSIRDESYEQRRPETFRSGSQSPSYRDMIDRRYSERSSSGGRNDDSHSRSSYEEARSPGYDQNDYRRNAGPVEMFDGKRRNEFIGNGNQNVRFGDNMSKLDAKSSSPPMVRPVRDILGDNAPSLKVVELRKSNNSKIAESSAQVQVRLFNINIMSFLSHIFFCKRRASFSYYFYFHIFLILKYKNTRLFIINLSQSLSKSKMRKNS